MSIQKCMPGLYPTRGLDYDCPISERKIYDALEKALPGNWYGWHSLKVRTERFGIAETDFVIADPNQEGHCSDFIAGNVITREYHV
jgi:hypothetical protein